MSFGDAAKPLVEGTTVNWPQKLTEAAGGELGALLGLTGPGRRAHRAADRPQHVAETLASTVNAHLATPFFSGETAATLAVAVEALGSPGLRQQSRRAATKWRWRSPRCAAARPNRTTRRSSRSSAATCTAPSDEQANLQTTVTAINDQRQSVSGVSLDEEMTNLISFQRGYQASARTLTAMDEMLETLIEHTGVVGL